MLIRIPKPWQLKENQTTPQSLYLNRRQIIAGLGLASGSIAGGAAATTAPFIPGRKLSFSKSQYLVDAPSTPYGSVTSYNNFYEFGTDKTDPARYAKSLITDPWSITVEGHANKTGTFSLADIIRPDEQEERIYRLRCVEAWSMVIPWVGVPLAKVLARFEPTSKAKYVQFETLLNQEQMRGTRRAVLDWPYVEGLRMDEAMNQLPLLATGLYGHELPNQNGAPLRLVVPWKYGFKSIKSIVKIRFTSRQPKTSWKKSAPREYGFYSNVNPNVDHPRWSQASERIIGGGGFSSIFARRKTEEFNGYGDAVAALYAGMNMKKNY
ncbi:Protein-methionine-sulfoxide reductase catalytic subunit MsrP [hydrothermal vent metagenome]|uniref:Protein-methionine-sulfoxide reductase catalytic subunit MsrP n=1 Tax=hydrothermal vent metagenome TaxID=652676 RepID=A0A3B0SSU6_9ZZZZ